MITVGFLIRWQVQTATSRGRWDVTRARRRFRRRARHMGPYVTRVMGYYYKQIPRGSRSGTLTETYKPSGALISLAKIIINVMPTTTTSVQGRHHYTTGQSLYTCKIIHPDTTLPIKHPIIYPHRLHPTVHKMTDFYRYDPSFRLTPCNAVFRHLPSSIFMPTADARVGC